MKLLLKLALAALAGALISLSSFAVIAQAQPTTPATVPLLPRLTLPAQDEYVIRENILTQAKVPKGTSAPETIGAAVPNNIKLYPLPPQIVQKVPKAQGHQYFVKGDDTVVLVSPSDWRIADVLKKKSSD